METTQSQAQAGAGSEATTETPQGAQADSLNNPGKELSFDERLKAATSPAEVNQLIADFDAGKVKSAAPEEKSPAETTELEKPEGETTIEGATKEVTTEETPAATTETPPATTTAATTKKEGEEDPEEKLPERIRLTNFSKVEKLALQLKRDDPKLTLAEAEVRAKAALGIKDEVKSTEETTASALPATLKDTDAKINELRALRTKAAKEDLDFAEVDRITNEIEGLQEHKSTLRMQEAEKASFERKAYDDAFDASEGKAAALYEFVRQPESAAFKRMAEVDLQLKENGDPLFDSPD
ncbi:MAG: hypothetical protein ACREH8_07390, partial [Opitutaceae bacterium]